MMSNQEKRVLQDEIVELKRHMQDCLVYHRKEVKTMKDTISDLTMLGEALSSFVPASREDEVKERYESIKRVRADLRKGTTLTHQVGAA